MNCRSTQWRWRRSGSIVRALGRREICNLRFALLFVTSSSRNDHMVLTPRRIGMAVLGAAIVAVAIVAQARQSNAVQGPAKVRGNVPGEWRYWGADAYSTRYSALDQINASNFGSLEVAWQWNASSLGADEYYRTTPLYANGRLFTVASTRRVAAAIDPETGETLWMYRLNEGIRRKKQRRQ